MTYTQQNAKLVLIGKENKLLGDNTLIKNIDKMLDVTENGKLSLYRIITENLTFYVSILIENGVKTVQINDIDTEPVIAISKSNKYIYLDNGPIDLLYLPFILLILERL